MIKIQLLSNNKGLTLVELMVVMVLSLLLMAAVYMTYQLQHASGQSQTQVTATQQDLRAAMDVISHDIMHAGLNPTFATIQGIPTNTSGAVSLESVMDFNGNGATNGIANAGEHVRYQVNANRQLERVDINAGVTQVIANNVTQLAFSYFGTQFTAINPTGPGGTLNNNEANSVRYVSLTITKESDQVDSQTGLPITRALQRTICRRN
jgi:prepilin-type N-terminal cleavage/methylation domain-containing protein